MLGSDLKSIRFNNIVHHFVVFQVRACVTPVILRLIMWVSPPRDGAFNHSVHVTWGVSMVEKKVLLWLM